MKVTGGQAKRTEKTIDIDADGILVQVDYDDVDAAHARYIAKVIIAALKAAESFEGGCAEEDE